MATRTLRFFAQDKCHRFYHPRSRARISDLAYLQAWSTASLGMSLPRPASEALALKFVAPHLWDVEKR